MTEKNYTQLDIYNGSKPYIFISYAHKDSDVVLPIIESMVKKGYRVWMDLGIEAGTEWSNNIAAHLRDCSAFVAFLSRNSIASENCLDEIAYAKSHKKASLMIFLEQNLTLPEGTDMQTARFQRMYLFRQSSAQSFLEQLSRSDILSPCVDRDSESTEYAAVSTEQVRAGKKSIPVAAVIAAAAVVVVGCVIGILSGIGKQQPSGGTPDEGTGNSSHVSDTSLGSNANADKEPEMSDVLTDMTFKLDGVVYQLPCDLSRLTDNGWTISTVGVFSDTTVMGRDISVFNMIKDGCKIMVELANPSGNAMPLSSCVVRGITVSAGTNNKFEIAKSIKPDSSADEIIAAFGSPNNRENVLGADSLIYYKDGSTVAGVRFYCYSGEDKPDSEIYIKSEITYAPTETSEKEPEYLSQYTAPTELGSDMKAGKVKLDGKLYQLPVPVRELLNNGWTVSQRPNYVVAGGGEYIVLSRNGVEMGARIVNLDALQTTPENCVVTEINCDAGELELPGGIKLGMSANEFETLVPEYFDEPMQASSSIIYSYNDYDSGYYIDLYVNKESGSLSMIRITVSSED